MTGVVELAAAAAVVAACARTTTERRQREEKAGLDLYSNYFKADLMSESTGQITTLAAGLPAELNAQAAASIQIIESYQQKRRRWFLGFSSTDFTGDIRTRILEEMKQWLMTQSDCSVDAPSVSSRLQYCSQFLLRPSVFQTTNDLSFLGTMAQVCSQLEGLLRQAAAGQRSGVERLGQVLGHGRELAEALLPALLLTLPGEAAAAAAARTGPGPEAAPPGGETDAARVLRSLLGTAHFRAEPLARVLEETRARWARSPLGHGSGLSESFRGQAHHSTRSAYLDLCCHLDRVSFFLAALRPYHSLAAMAGDIAMCWLRESLCHLLQEFEKALLQLRQSRLEVLRAAKLQLQELAKHVPKAGTEAFRWMQGLRQVDDVHLDGLHRGIVKLCAEVRLGMSTAREVELSAATRRKIADMTSAFGSADFQSRCAPALRERLTYDMQELSRLARSGDSPQEAHARAIESSQSP